jgi:mono/diheme cytochrome c family protein
VATTFFIMSLVTCMGANGGAGDTPSAPDLETIMRDGRAVYLRVCANCHGDRGSNPQVAQAIVLDGYRRLGDTTRILRSIIHGRGFMGPQGGALTDYQIAAVTTFVRNAWGNDFGIVMEEEVARLR